MEVIAISTAVTGVIGAVIVIPIIGAFKNVKRCRFCCGDCEKEVQAVQTDLEKPQTQKILATFIENIKNLTPRKRPEKIIEEVGKVAVELQHASSSNETQN